MNKNDFLFVCDFINNAIRMITWDGTVSTFCGNHTSDGSTSLSKKKDKKAVNFQYPTGIAISPNLDGTLYVTNNNDQTILKITQSGTVRVLCGASEKAGFKDGKGSKARFNFPVGIAVSRDGAFLYVCDSNNHAIRKVSTVDGTVTTLCGSKRGGSKDGVGSLAEFNLPAGIAISEDGALFVADSNNHTIRKVTASGEVSTLCGFPRVSGWQDGIGAEVLFSYPEGIAVDANTIYVADCNNNCIRKISTLDGVVTTLCGGQTVGQADGKGTDAKFSAPVGIAVAANGTLFVADSDNHAIRKVTSEGEVTTFCGGLRRSGTLDSQGTAARFNSPEYLVLYHRTLLWTPNNHPKFPPNAKRRVMVVLMMSAKKADGTPWHPEVQFHLLPKEVVMLFLQWAITLDD